MSMTLAASGALSFAVDGAPTTLSGGSLAGRALALAEVVRVRGQLDSLAGNIAGVVNTAQAAGVDLDGNAGAPLFSGTTAATFRTIQTEGRALATAPAGSPAGSRDSGNLVILRKNLEDGRIAETMNGILFDISSRVAGREITSEALDTIAASARISLEQQAGVDLDQEAANLMRYQQAFQASGRAMQVASDIFETLLGVG
jgi:flagellar hook-associated protein 1 FlgK